MIIITTICFGWAFAMCGTSYWDFMYIPIIHAFLSVEVNKLKLREVKVLVQVHMPSK